MTSPQARKGSQFERDVVEFLQAHGFPYAERAYGAGRPQDVGDIDGVVGWTLGCKAHKALALAGWADEAEAERVNGRRRFSAVIAKRRGHPTSDRYVVMSLVDWARLISDDDA